MFKKIFGINTEKENSNNVNVDDLYGEIDVLKEEIESLLDVKEKKEKDLKELSFKLTVLSATLRDKDEEIKMNVFSTGSITVNIDDGLWQGQPVSAKTPVTIIGEIDIDYKPTKRVEMDVDQVKF